VDIIFKGRQTDVPERFRRHAIAKLDKIEKLCRRAIRVDVEVSSERNPRQAGRKDRVELTITSRGPAIRAEAAAEDRFVALDLAFTRLESRLRRASDRRKARRCGHASVRLVQQPEEGPLPDSVKEPAIPAAHSAAADRPGADEADWSRQDDGGSGGEGDDVVPIQMVGEGPLVVREKFHAAKPMSIDEALFEMELVGHDFFLFRDTLGGLPSVVYRRRGYQYGVLRLVEEQAAAPAGRDGEPPEYVNGQRSAVTRARIR
jgi:ribosomal subunit interface protein